MNKVESKIITSSDFLLQIKAKYKLQSTYALCKLMDEHRRSIDRYLDGEPIKKASVMVKVAELLDTDLSYVIYNIMAEEAEKDGEQDVADSFVQTAQKYAPLTLAVSACFCLFFLPFSLNLI